MSLKFPIVATTLMGLENVLADEIEKLGGQNCKILKRAVKFEGNKKLLYASNLCLRTALRILMPIDHFLANNDQELYLKIKQYAWEKHFEVNQSFKIETSVSGSVFTHSKYVALKSKDAIVDRFREKTGLRPNIEKDQPDFIINIHIQNNFVEVALDASGVSLDKRGYRKKANEAPINEVLAAGIIALSKWDMRTPFYDPMSGSGTFAIEAALMATKTPPGFKRSFAFEKWKDYDAQLFLEIRNFYFNKISETETPIIARDIESDCIEIITENVISAGMEDYIKIKKMDFFESESNNTPGILYLNPPYGERLKLNESENYYKQIGDTLKQKYTGFEAWIISSNFEALKRIGLKANLKINLINGGLDAKLQSYDLFKGKKNE